MEEIFLFLNKYTNIGYIKFCKIYKYLNGKIEDFFNLDRQDFVNIGIKEKDINNIFNNLKKYNFEKEKKELDKYGIKMCNILDVDYPYLLSNIYDPPIMMYYKGKMIHNENSLAIVGARKCSNYGIKVVEEFAGYLSNYFSIVSGFAYGIDSIAHRSAIRNKKRTIAIMGVGLDRYYPEENKNLAQDILDNNGLLISEFPIGTKLLKSNFPRRNRIISGISSGVLVIEAGLKSGTFITANCALEQGRDLFVVPGNIYSKESIGANEIIKKGANLVTKPEDILEIMDMEI